MAWPPSWHIVPPDALLVRIYRLELLHQRAVHRTMRRTWAWQRPPHLVSPALCAQAHDLELRLAAAYRDALRHLG